MTGWWFKSTATPAICPALIGFTGQPAQNQEYHALLLHRYWRDLISDHMDVYRPGTSCGWTELLSRSDSRHVWLHPFEEKRLLSSLSFTSLPLTHKQFINNFIKIYRHNVLDAIATRILIWTASIGRGWKGGRRSINPRLLGRSWQKQQGPLKWVVYVRFGNDSCDLPNAFYLCPFSWNAPSIKL